MKETTRKLINDAITKWLASIVICLSENATQAYAAGELHANGYTKAGVSMAVVQKDALAYGEKYRKKLMEDGEITVSIPLFDDDNKFVGVEVDEHYPWLKNTETELRAGIADIITRGIAEGKATGVRVNKYGYYPVGTIAHELQKLVQDTGANAGMVARTETAHCYYEGEIERYTRAGVQVLRFAGGPNACDLCEALIGKLFLIGTQPPIPMHPCCRCDYIPEFPTPEELARMEVVGLNA